MAETDMGGGYTKRDGIVYGPDGKPCRSCNSLKDLLKMKSGAAPALFSANRETTTVPRQDTPAQSTTEVVSAKEEEAEESSTSTSRDQDSLKARYDPAQCPPDVEALGRSTWTFLHTAAANYPPRPTPVQQNDMSAFIRTFSMIYPCWSCAEEFREWLARRENQPVLDQGWAGLGQWMCRAHNEVNRKLGKEEFDCKLWRQRWKDGFKDGRCDP